MKVYEKISDLQPLVGEIIGTSEWVSVEQGRINQFADATGDHQWIHVDVERAKAGPFGTPIAHGFLTLSLLPEFTNLAYRVNETRSGVNYGLDKVRFPAPVPVNSRLRAQFKLLSYEALEGGGAQTKVEMIVEREGGQRPVCIAESIVRRYP
ncbi:MaoC family dehydratase [Cupriavidus numazuensis]|uniref:Enoyl-CoA hydratase 1 n=1 Tax=Cupriavidus numazuensis TaxID=221992 RepID=A0ABN7PZW3_9BURK|nr:MaoC family dehydratase [Cupriavidus numazuensis]CAG2150254.1 putative enoyl-CoA hydratase 1 [Cupriavidus numazuensis]